MSDALVQLSGFLDRVSNIKIDQLAFTIYQTKEFEMLVVSLVTKGQPTSQLKQGIDKDGQIIGRYSLRTELETGGRKKAGTPYTLEDTGFYYESHEVIAFLGGFTIVADSVSIYDGDFLERLEIDEQDVQNLTDGNLQIVIDRIAELLPDEIRKLVNSIR